MPASQRRRRSAADGDDEDNQVQRRPRRHNERVSDDDDAENADGEAGGRHDGSHEQLVKKMVRYALACEFARTPIRRDGIKEKVLGTQGRSFKKVFDDAQKQLIQTFGMHMVELPARDKLTTEQLRKAARSQSQKETSSNAYILTTVLGESYRTSPIILPSKVQSREGEASYMALYTTIVAIITLAGGELSDARLRRFLKRLNADETMPSLNPGADNAAVEKTDTVLQRMVKQGYLVKVVEAKVAGDEESTTWHVGPRGKIEVDNEAIAAMARKVYGGSTDELEKQLQVSLKVKDYKAAKREQDDAESGLAGIAARRRGSRKTRAEEEDEVGNGDPGPSSRRRSGRSQREQEEVAQNGEDEGEDTGGEDEDSEDEDDHE